MFAGVDGDGNADKEPIDGDNNDDIQVDINFNHSVDHNRINVEFQPPQPFTRDFPLLRPLL